MTTIAAQIAQTIIDDLKAAISDHKFAPRLWTRAGLDHVRIYTGPRDEHLRVYATGRTERSQARMSWGAQIDDVLATDPTNALSE